MRNKQGITIAALIVAIIGLSIGFAAFSNTLTIRSSADIHPDDSNFIVQFSKYSDRDATGSENLINPTALTSEYGDAGLIPTSDKKTLQDLHAKFTEPGQSVTYELFVRNTGSYVAYLKELVFGNAEHATNGETYKHCYAATTRKVNGETESIPAIEQATPSLVSAACEGISISVSIGTATNLTYSAQPISLGNQALAANNGYVSASVTISYASGSAYVDGPMEVEFGNISFTASTNPATSQQQEQQGGQEEPQQADYSNMFVSYEESVLSEYIGSSPAVEIPDGLSLPHVIAIYDPTKCPAFVEANMAEDLEKEGITSTDACEMFSEEWSEASIADIQRNGTEELYTFQDSSQRYPITSIGSKAFYDQGISSIVIGNSITTIGSGAFGYNDLTSVDIPSSVTYIGKEAFSKNSNLTNVRIHNNQSKVSLGSSAFPVGTQIQFDDTTITYGS